MPDQIYIIPRLERQLEQMAKQTNAPAVAAQRAQQIIDSLIQGNTPVPGCAREVDSETVAPAGAGLLRYRKDKRVKNSLKFNLGKGYRLICIKEKKAIYLMFVGDHDSSDAWLDHFTRKRPHKADMSLASVFAVENHMPSRPGARLPDKAPFSDPLPGKIPQDMLRRVFRGLCAPS